MLNPQVTGQVIRTLAQIKLAQRHRLLSVVLVVTPTMEVKKLLTNLREWGIILHFERLGYSQHPQYVTVRVYPAYFNTSPSATIC